MTKELKQRTFIRMFISRIIPNSAEGGFLRELLFHSETILPESDTIVKLINKHFPEIGGK